MTRYNQSMKHDADQLSHLRTTSRGTSSHGAPSPTDRDQNIRVGKESSLLQSMFRSVDMTEHPTVSNVRFSENTTRTKSADAATVGLPPKSSRHDFCKAQSSPAAIPSRAPSAITKPTWNVNKLQDVPPYYPLEITAITLHPHSLTSLTHRIATFMKDHSITSIYNDEKGRVDCMTSSLVHFSVQLWNGKPTTTRNAVTYLNNVIVEIQRRQGCCIEMQRLRQELIHYLTSEEQNEELPTVLHVSTVTSRTSPVRVLQKLVEQYTGNDGTGPIPALTTVDCEKAYAISCRLLKSKRLDESRLGLESLCILADTQKVMTQQACYVSSKILTDAELQTMLMQYFANIEVSSDDDFMDLDDEKDGTLEYSRGRFFGVMHILALKTLTHALDTAVEARNSTPSGDNFVGGINLSTAFWNHALQAMLYNMHISRDRPLEACLSVRCLRRLHTLLPEALNEHLCVYASRGQLDHFLLDARSVGRSCYLQLERETQQFMNQLGLVAH